MSAFEYVMVLVSIVIALAIAHLLTALAEGIRRYRGHGDPIRLDAVFLLWVGFLLIYLVSFWWWEFKLQEVLTEWTFGLYLFIIGYAISLFMLAEILVPHRMRGVADTYEYFIKGRRWFFGGLIITQLIDIFDTFLKGYEWGTRPVFLLTYLLVFVVAFIGIFAKRRSIQLTIAVIAFANQLWYVIQELAVLGSW